MKIQWENPTIEPITSLADASNFPVGGLDQGKKGSLSV